MLTTIHIQGFKGFRDTQITPLRKVNLILGGQNVGKTSLLEAIYFGASSLANYQQLASLFRAAEGRDSQRYVQSVLERSIRTVDLTDESGITLRTLMNSELKTQSFFGLETVRDTNYLAVRAIAGAEISDATDALIRMARKPEERRISPAAALKGIPFLNPLTVSVHLPNQFGLVQLLDRTVMARKKRALMEMLRSIEPRLEDMHSLSPDGEQRIYVELQGESEALPLPQLGHGFSRLVYLYCSLLVTEAKLALIDEVENGIHYSSLPILFQGIQDIAAKHGVQTMMTTHSWDCIRSAYKTFADAKALKDFQLIRLEREEDNVRAVLINDDALETVMEAGYEVR